MIPFEFEYMRPGTVPDALRAYRECERQGKRVVYYAGGTELIGMARLGQIEADAVIDLKEIPDLQALEAREGTLVFGAAVSLNRLAESALFPLLGKQAQAVADHTSRNRITIGGNIAGRTPYRETVLPLLLCDGKAVVARGEGTETAAIRDIFDRELRLAPGEFVVQWQVPESAAALPYVSMKRTRLTRIEYPLVSLAAVRQDERIRIALSGVCGFPFRSEAVEDALNDRTSPLEKRIDRAIAQLPAPVLSDLSGSGAYRTFVLRQMLGDAARRLEGGAGS